MKFFAVKPDSNYRMMFPEDSVYESELWEFKCKSLAGKLPLHFRAHFSDKTEKPIPDIAWLGMSTFAFKDEVAKQLLEILEGAGELLPFLVEGETWYCFNVLACSDNAVDPDNSTYEVDDGDVRFGLVSPAFVVENLPNSPLFKIKEDNYTTLFCADKRKNDEDIMNNFFCAVAGHGYTGVKFEEVFEG